MIIVPKFERGILPEYPRPQLKRGSYMSLNGEWDYAVTKSRSAPEVYDGVIIVPYSPESKLSGVSRRIEKNEFLHYRKRFVIPDGFDRGRVLINFGACDQVCAVYVNGAYVGGHKGGYTPFSFDITGFLAQTNELGIVVADDADSDVYGRGKQRYKRGGIWYTAVSGLWQSVWLESVPDVYLTDLKLTPDFDGKRLYVKCEANVSDAAYTVEVTDGDTVVAKAVGNSAGQTVLDVSACKPWTFESPELYRVVVTLGSDVVESYFGLRSFTVKDVNGRKFFALNGVPVFHNGLLDQGYWNDGIYTPESNEKMYGLLKRVKELGFNMLRKHAKIESRVWYYYCDTLGIAVWQDMVNGGAKYRTARLNLGPFINLRLDDKNYASMGRGNPESRKQFVAETAETVDMLYNCVSVCAWTPFNEGWGQFDTTEITDMLGKLDGTRQIDHASGWQDYGAGDVYSRHVYFRKVRLKNDGARVLALTEFGGYSYNASGKGKVFGYKRIRSARALCDKLCRLYVKQILPMIEKQGLGAAIYTQLTDVEDEKNGIFTSDFKLKIDAERIKEVNKRLYDAFSAALGKS